MDHVLLDGFVDTTAIAVVIVRPATCERRGLVVVFRGHDVFVGIVEAHTLKIINK